MAPSGTTSTGGRSPAEKASRSYLVKTEGIRTIPVIVLDAASREA